MFWSVPFYTIIEIGDRNLFFFSAFLIGKTEHKAQQLLDEHEHIDLK